MTHTKGKWYNDGSDVRCQGGYFVADCDGGRNGVDIPLEEAEANARLIAAAPDLLAACKKLLDAISSREGCPFCGESYTRDHDDDCILAPIEAAVANARGGE